MLQTNGYILLPKANIERWDIEELKEILDTWAGYEGRVSYEIKKKEPKEQVVSFAVSDFNVLLTYTPQNMVLDKIATLDEPQRLANEPEDKKRKLQFEHTLVPTKEHEATIRYEITYNEEMQDGKVATTSVLEFAQAVLRILISVTDMMEGTAIIRSPYLDGRPVEKYLLVSRECLADSYYQNASERSIPLAIFGTYTIDTEEKFNVSGSITGLEAWFGDSLRYTQFPLADKDLYRVLGRSIYEALFHRDAKDKEQLFAWEDRTVSLIPCGEKFEIIWDNNQSNYVGIR